MLLQSEKTSLMIDSPVKESLHRQAKSQPKPAATYRLSVLA
jgi:hypothetical protein